ncbi:hypothetical protein BOV89_11150 [Solemya velum gill symbiont]|nr:hypothetical protein BOV89_11150 [Solemya velum gill symbiont]
MHGSFQKKDSWVKGDMVYTVGFQRLDLIKFGRRGPDGKRQYFNRQLDMEQLGQVQRCVLHGIHLSWVTHHLPE